MGSSGIEETVRAILRGFANKPVRVIGTHSPWHP
jgi:hypothetical protein